MILTLFAEERERERREAWRSVLWAQARSGPTNSVYPLYDGRVCIDAEHGVKRGRGPFRTAVRKQLLLGEMKA